jgi:hypothetical protein
MSNPTGRGWNRLSFWNGRNSGLKIRKVEIHDADPANIQIRISHSKEKLGLCHHPVRNHELSHSMMGKPDSAILVMIY